MRYFADALNNEQQSAGEIEKLQLAKFNKLINYVRREIPFYAAKYLELPFEPLRSLEDLEKIPILTKEEIRTEGSSFVSNSTPRKYGRQVATGGSTGVPLKVFHDRRFPTEILGWRTLAWWRADPGENIAFIYRIQKRGWSWKLNQLIWFPTKRIFLDASLMSEDKMDSFQKALEHIQPKILQGYTGAVVEFAKHCEKNNYKIDGLDAIWVTSAPLVGSQRNFIERVLGAPVFDQYGCSEVFWLAAECSKQHGLHIIADSRIIEFVDENKRRVPAGEYGDVLVTDLENYFFPLIRYRNEDRGRLSQRQCSCGVPFPLMESIKGRVSDVVRLKDGSSIAGEYLTTIFDDAPQYIRGFQIYQDANYDVELRCEIEQIDRAVDVCLQKTDDLRKLTENRLKITLKIVEDLQHDRGKVRFIISDAAPP